jgi:hypothetical protein
MGDFHGQLLILPNQAGDPRGLLERRQEVAVKAEKERAGR